MHRDIEAEYAPCCRICLSTDNHRGLFGAGHELISPCRCKGSQQFVHRSCLDQWRAVKEGTAFSHCTTCKAQFHLLVELLEDDMCLRMKFWLFVSRDVFLIFLAIQAVIVAIAGVAFLSDKDGKFRNRFTDWMLSKHPLPFYYCVGVVVFFALVGLFGLLLHCFSCDYRDDDPSCLPEPSYGCLDCETSRSGDDDDCVCVVIMVVVLVFALLGIFYGFIAATMAFQKIMQRHYHILKKKELTKVYVVEDLKGGYSMPPKMDPKHEQRLKMLELM
ncbi:uncharacterized protein [Miscanthus floridulus]|uniref:uncharacterized protein n=1 Tax=Miscanthus floridulus TaxID=154761 RepID=UPI0034583AE2